MIVYHVISIDPQSMTNASRKSATSTALDATVDTSDIESRVVIGESQSVSPSAQSPDKAAKPKKPFDTQADFFGFIEGSASAGSAQLRRDLRSRLVMAAWVTCASLAVFFAFRLVVAPLDGWISAMNYGLHLLAMLSAGASAALLSRKEDFGRLALRTHEAMIFVPAVICLAVVHWTSAVYHAHHFNVPVEAAEVANSPLPRLLKAWLLIMFGYAIFIPNNWQRAAIIEGLIALLPVSIISILFFIDPIVRDAVFLDWSWSILDGLALGVAAATAVFGVYTINRLRREVAEAREFGQYRLTKLIGSGGMGEVYLAEHLMMKRPCAVKLIRAEKAEDPTILARFEREVQLTAKLSHWNNIDIFDYGRTADGAFYYVMEFLPGMSLKHLVSEHGPLPPGRVIYLLRQICWALNEAHSHGLVHRDIKPANIFAAYRGGLYDIAKLLDFGLVRSNLHEPNELTMVGSVTGSPLFISPEQVTGEAEADPRIDIYALGGVAYFLLTGTPPFQDEKPMKVMIAHVNAEPEPPSKRKRGVPKDLEAVVLKCLQKEPQNRYESADELLTALEACASASTWNEQEAEQWWGMNEEARLVDPLAEDPESEDNDRPVQLVGA